MKQRESNGKDSGVLECGHPESSRRIDWGGYASVGVGDWHTPYSCADCGLAVRDPSPAPTFGESLLIAVVGAGVIWLLTVVGVLQYLLIGIWLMLALGVLALVYSAIKGLVVFAFWVVGLIGSVARRTAH